MLTQEPHPSSQGREVLLIIGGYEFFFLIVFYFVRKPIFGVACSEAIGLLEPLLFFLHSHHLVNLFDLDVEQFPVLHNALDYINGPFNENVDDLFTFFGFVVIDINVPLSFVDELFENNSY